MDEDTPKEMCTPKRGEMYPKQQGKFLKEKKGTKDNKISIVITLQKKNKPKQNKTFHSLQKMYEGQICVFLFFKKKKKRMLHELTMQQICFFFSALVKKKFLFLFFFKYNTVRYTATEE